MTKIALAAVAPPLLVSLVSADATVKPNQHDKIVGSSTSGQQPEGMLVAGEFPWQGHR